MDGISFLCPERRTVNDRVSLLLATAGVDDADFTIASHDSFPAVRVDYGPDIVKPNRSLTGRLGVRLFGSTRCRATDVESPHRELCTGLADRLRCDDAYGFAEIDHRTAR